MFSKAKGWVLAVIIGAGVSVGLCLGLGSYTFYYAKGSSYLTNDPKACVNCHIMREQYDGWINSSHRSVATCNDCHAPHQFIPKYFIKAKNGFFHSLYFTTGNYPDPIRITDSNQRVTEQTCRFCHQAVVHNIDVGVNKEPLSCIRCHRSVGHMH